MSKRVVIVEDEFFVANHLKKILQKNGYTVIAVFHDGATVIKKIPFIEDVIYLLDIQLSDDTDGISIASVLEKRNIPFVFLTANTDKKTFDEAIFKNPVSYISKPFKEMDVIAGVTLAAHKMEGRIKIESGKELIMLESNEVLFFKSDNVYVEIVLTNNSRVVRKKLKDLYESLPANFAQCHKSYIVNKEKIDRIKGNTIYFGQIEIPLSKTYHDNFSF